MADLGRFRALVATEAGAPAEFVEVGEEALGEGAVIVEVAYSSLNYKDAMAASGSAPVVRRFPLVIGIDLAGTVVASGDDSVAVGDRVLAAGSGLGEEHPGGYSRYARLPAEFLIPIPIALDAVGAMALGTAGLTALLCCMALERNGSSPEALRRPAGARNRCRRRGGFLRGGPALASRLLGGGGHRPDRRDAVPRGARRREGDLPR